MFIVTDSALEHLAQAISRIEDPKPQNVCFRIVPDPSDKLSLTVDTLEPGDTEYGHEGIVVLAISNEILERCEGQTLDLDDSGNLLLT